MAQMSITARATGFGAHHAVAAIDHLLDGARLSDLPKAGPATARIEFGASIKQKGRAADARVATSLPMVFVLSRERSLGRGTACHFEIGRAHV